MLDSGGERERGGTIPPGGVLSEESYFSSNLSFLELQDDPDTLLRSAKQGLRTELLYKVYTM